VRPYSTLPRPTSGHHFSDLLACPQRAWLHYYGNPKDQVKDPAYLRALQQEGVEHEQAIYQRHFPDAIRIPEKQKPEARYQMTVDAMKAGVPTILQGYILTTDGVGVCDILEKVGADPSTQTGYVYRVGEIKRSATLMTAHVLQAAWYTELLARTQGQTIQEACFFPRSGERTLVDLRTVQADYQAAKAQLQELRASKVSPGPHLNNLCPSCHWRGVCMPELIAADHLSLIPGVSRRQAKMLQELGVTTWRALEAVSGEQLEELGFGAYEIEQLRAALRCLLQGSPPLRQPLRPDIFLDLRVVVLEFPELAEQRRAGERPTPSAIYYEADSGQTGRIGVSSSGENLTADLTPLANGARLAFYGGTDLGAFMPLARQGGWRLNSPLDVFSVVEKLVHAPAPGLELEALYSFVSNVPVQRLSGPERVAAVREVINWIARSL
jgi:CRISPR/Cas system-associated exonuclease Cas4 (RecB family)